MKDSEFWEALELAFGPVQGRFLAQDLYLPGVDATAVEALANGQTPRRVWELLVAESGADPAVQWIHRRARPKR